VQNKLHWAIHGQMAAEVIHHRADAGKEHMGLTSWKDAPKGKIQKFDVVVAKNYLTKHETDACWARLNVRSDWSAELVGAATVADLNPDALVQGRQRFVEKNPHLAVEMADWDDPTFLSKLKLTRVGQLARAALLLFGRDEAARYLPRPKRCRG